MTKPFQSYILHLPRAESRQANVQKLQSILPQPAFIFNCIDGKSLSPEAINQVYFRNLLQPCYPFKLNEGEIAVFMTYRKIWQTMVQNSVKIALIIEDDASLDLKTFNIAFDLAMKHISLAGFVRLDVRKPKPPFNILDSIGNCNILEEQVPSLRMACQVLTLPAAENLLDSSKKFDRPVDSHVQLLHHTRQPVLSVWPTGITEISGEIGGSTIHKKSRNSSPMHTVSREVKRSLYRQRIRKAVIEKRPQMLKL